MTTPRRVYIVETIFPGGEPGEIAPFSTFAKALAYAHERCRAYGVVPLTTATMRQQEVADAIFAASGNEDDVPIISVATYTVR